MNTGHKEEMRDGGRMLGKESIYEDDAVSEREPGCGGAMTVARRLGQVVVLAVVVLVALEVLPLDERLDALLDEGRVRQESAF